MDIPGIYVDTSIWSEIGTSINSTWCLYRLCKCYKHWRHWSIYFNKHFGEYVCLTVRKRISLLANPWYSKMLTQWMMQWEWLDNKLENTCQHLQEGNNITNDYCECLYCIMYYLLVYTLFGTCRVTLNKYYYFKESNSLTFHTYCTICSKL